MFDILETSTVSIAVQENPFLDEKRVLQVPEGSSLSDIVKAAGIPADLMLRYHVTVALGSRVATVPMDQWRLVKPKAGALVSIHPRPGDPGTLAAILTSVVSAAAPSVASWLFPSLTGTALGLATAGITVIGALAVRALIPPPITTGSQAQDDPNYNITGSSNAPNPYGVIPTVFGRHQMFFPPMTSGYTETAGEDVLFRGRYTLGHGTVALESLKIGDTSVLDFDDLELEFRNVDQTETEASIPGIGAKTLAWRSGSDVMQLYPDNIFEESLNIELLHETENVRTTQVDTREVSVDISFNGLYRISPNDGDRKSTWVDFDISYRPVGATPWTNVEVGYRVTGNTTAFFRKTISFTPTEGAGQYEVKVERVADPGDDNPVNTSYWTALRSVRAGTLPSDPEIAEVCIKVRASQQLSGRLDTFNGVVWKMVPIWNGSSWTAPQKTRHPAWAFAHALKGPMVKRPQPDSKIDLDDLKAWADDEPHWTCDLVIDQPMTVNQILNTIAATGRATRHMKNLKHTILRDGADGPVVAHFTPRNSFGFEANLIYYKEIHGFHVEVLSEQLNWQYDRITVYADGYNAGNATEFETLRLTGVVLKDGDVDQGNAYRLARYHLAQVFLRPEVFTFRTALDHVRLLRGDKIRFVHDVPLIGLGSARIKSLTATSITLDETIDTTAGNTRLVVRTADGNEMLLPTATRANTDTFAVTSTTGAGIGDLVLVERTTVESFVLMVNKIEPSADMTATIECIPAAPAVLTADTGTIPSYNPSVTTPNGFLGQIGPARPVVLGVYSDATSALYMSFGARAPRIAVSVQSTLSSGASATSMQVRWRGEATGGEWVAGPTEPVNFTNRYLTNPLTEGETYDVEIRSVDSAGRSLGWVTGGTTVATVADIVPPDVTGLTKAVDTYGVLLKWTPTYVTDINYYQVRLDSDGLQGWAGAEVIAEVFHPSAQTLLPVQAGHYRIKAVDFSGQVSANDVSVEVTANEISAIGGLVALDPNDQIFTYNAAGTTPSPATSTVTAVPSYFVGTPYFEFLVDGVQEQVGLSDSFTYTPAPAFASMPQKLTVNLRAGGPTGEIKATDQMFMVGMKAGQSAVVPYLGNSAHVVPATSDGTVTDYSGSGTEIFVFAGTTQLQFDFTGTAPGTFDVSAAVQTGTITIGSITDIGNNARVNTHSNMGTNVAVIRYTITGTDPDGEAFSFQLDQTITKVRNGADGSGTNPLLNGKQYTGRIYYNSLQSPSPGLPSTVGASFDFNTGQFSSLPSGWSHDQPTVSITSTTVFEWSCAYLVEVDGDTGVISISFSDLSAAIQVAQNMQSDNFVTGSQGWAIFRKTGNAEFNDVKVRGEIQMEGVESVLDVISQSWTGRDVGVRVTSTITDSVIRAYSDANAHYCIQGVAWRGSGYYMYANALFSAQYSGDAIWAFNGGGGGSTCMDARAVRTNGGAVQIGLSGEDGGYGIYIPGWSHQGGLDASGAGWVPFTGVHQGMIAKGVTVEPGDILIDVNVVISTVSDAFTEVARSSVANQKGAIGILQRFEEWIIPPAFLDRPAMQAAQTQAAIDAEPGEPPAAVPNIYIDDPANYSADFDMVNINAVGEGSINVCGQGGDIEVGDLIVTSSTPGKGMRQSDDIVRSYTVAKAREAASFTSAGEVKMIACVYLCG